MEARCKRLIAVGVKGIVENSFRRWGPMEETAGSGKRGHGVVSMPFSCTIVSFL